MKLFSRLTALIASAAPYLPFLSRSAASSAVPPERIPAPKRNAHFIRYRETTGRPVFGPAILPDQAYAHVSRQTCRNGLRAIQFANVSARHSDWSRRERRRYASLLARLEYRRMMRDNTNAIPEGAASVFMSMTHAELAAAV